MEHRKLMLQPPVPWYKKTKRVPAYSGERQADERGRASSSSRSPCDASYMRVFAAAVEQICAKFTRGGNPPDFSSSLVSYFHFVLSTGARTYATERRAASVQGFRFLAIETDDCFGCALSFAPRANWLNFVERAWSRAGVCRLVFTGWWEHQHITLDKKTTVFLDSHAVHTASDVNEPTSYVRVSSWFSTTSILFSPRPPLLFCHALSRSFFRT